MRLKGHIQKNIPTQGPFIDQSPCKIMRGCYALFLKGPDKVARCSATTQMLQATIPHQLYG